MKYELWDVDTGNMIGSFETEAGALAQVRGLVAANAPGYADDLSLGRFDASGGTLIAEGAALIARALAGWPRGRTTTDAEGDDDRRRHREHDAVSPVVYGRGRGRAGPHSRRLPGGNRAR